MMGMPNPWLILGALAACSGSYFYGHHKGWWERDVEMQTAIAQKNEEARQIEHKLAELTQNNSVQLKEANDALDKKSSALERAIANGRVRFPTASCAQAPASSTPTPGDQQARSESDQQVNAASDAERETLRLIAQIAAEGDRAINQLNACIDNYEAVRSQINGNHR